MDAIISAPDYEEQPLISPSESGRDGRSAFQPILSRLLRNRISRRVCRDNDEQVATESGDCSVPGPPSSAEPGEPEANNVKDEVEEEELLQLSGCGGSFFGHPQRLGHKMIGLTLMCFLGFGCYFCFDNPGALQKEIIDIMKVSTFEFASLYSWYSWPNSILPIVGGLMMDSVFGMRLSTCLFALLIIVGQAIFATGAFAGNYRAMLIGRFVLGLGGESLQVAQNTYAVAWFKNSEINMAFGLQLSIARVGATVNFWAVTPVFRWFSTRYDPYTSLGLALVVGVFLSIMSFLFAVVLGFMDKRHERLVRNREVTPNGDMTQHHQEPNSVIILPNKKKKKKKITTTAMKIVLIIFGLPLKFWLLCLICATFYVGVFSFVSLGQVFTMKKYHMESSEANFLIGIVYLISAPFAPFAGLLIDRTGYNLVYCAVAILSTILCHFFLAFSYVTPYFGIVLCGIGYSLLASALWPIAAYIISQEQLGIAYGIMQGVQNAGTGCGTLSGGFIVDHYGYMWLEIAFIGWLLLSLFAIFVLWAVDYCGNGFLNMAANEREAVIKEQKRLAKELGQRVDKRRNGGLRPRTASELRNRYLCRLGAVPPSHFMHPDFSPPGDVITFFKH